MRFLLDTNILIPLEDSKIILEPNLTNFVRLATQNHHNLLYHPASERDIARDTNQERRRQTLERIQRYGRLENPPTCPWNTPETNDNDAVDNEILYALERNAVHGLVTEDREIHRKARERGLGDKIYVIQTAEDYLKRLHSISPVSLPNIREVFLYEMDVTHPFFNSLREGYDGFNGWFEAVSKEGRKAWIYGDNSQQPEAICIYAVQTNEPITTRGDILRGPALKLCTFKVGETVRGQKIGELFLKAAFRYATDNELGHIFITAKPHQQPFLIDLLLDFGFEDVGQDKNRDHVYVKTHPVVAPDNYTGSDFDYIRKFFPHYRATTEVRKFVVPIQPAYHDILFPDYQVPQGSLFRGTESTIGNAIKLAYLCHAQQGRIQPGDLLLFYRSHDVRAITSLGVVEKFCVSSDHDEIASIVRRRTVYNMDEIRRMANRQTKVILFRLIGHFNKDIPFTWMKAQRIVNGNIQSIWNIGDDGFRKVREYAES